MTPHHPEMWRLLQRTSRFEKYAAEGDSAAALAVTCDQAYDFFMSKAAAYPGPPSAEGSVLKAIAFAADLYSSANALGEKVASVNDAENALERLATVVYVDSALKTAEANMPEAGVAQARHVRLLGREYGVELLRSLVG